MRWRLDSREESIRRVLSLAVALIANLAFLFASLFLLQVSSSHAPLAFSSQVEVALQVRLFEMPDMPPSRDSVSSSAPQQPSLPAPVQSARNIRRQTEPVVRIEKSPAARVANASTSNSTVAPLQLFNADGSLRLAPGATAEAPTTDFPTHSQAASASSPLAHRDVLPYSATAFERVWAVPRDETLAGELVRKTTVAHTWRTPWGTQIHCEGSILVPPSLLGCGWGFVPRATAEELQSMRANPPPPRDAAPTNGAAAEK